MVRKNHLMAGLLAFVLFGIFGMLAAGGLSAAPVTQAEDPSAIVQAYYDAYNSKDVETAVLYIAEDAVFINPVGTFTGAAAIKAHLATLVNDGLTFDLSDFKNDNGRVQYAYKVLINGEVVETGTDGLTIVKDGKIIFDGTVGTEVQLPTTGTEPPLNGLGWVAIAGALLVGGGALLLARKKRSI